MCVSKETSIRTFFIGLLSGIILYKKGQGFYHCGCVSCFTIISSRKRYSETVGSTFVICGFGSPHKPFVLCNRNISGTS
jgi:hypothetical protein